MRRIVAGVLLLALTAFTGCGIFWDDPYVTVTTSPLNWIEIHYYNANREPIRRETVRVNGAGFVEVKTGTSRRVSDSFAKTPTDATWDDFSTQNYNVDPEHVREVFQDLVNAGLFDKDKMFKSTKFPSPGRFVAVRAAVDNKTDWREFKRPTLGRKRQVVGRPIERRDGKEAKAGQGETK